MSAELLYFDQGTALQNISIVRNNVLPKILLISKSFFELGIGPLTKERFKDLLRNGSEGIENEIHETMNSQIHKSGLKSRKLSEQVKSEIDDALADTMAIIESFRSQFSSLRPEIIDAISIDKNGNPHLSKEGQGQIEELFKVYVSSEKGKSLRDKHEKAVKALNSFLSEFKNRQQLPGFGWQRFANLFELVDETEISLKPKVISYDALAAFHPVPRNTTPEAIADDEAEEKPSTKAKKAKDEKEDAERIAISDGNSPFSNRKRASAQSLN